MTEGVGDRGATIADLRRRIAAVNPRGTREAAEPTSPAQPNAQPDAEPARGSTRPALQLPEHLRPVFPPTGLPRGSMVELIGATGAAVSMVAAITRAGGSVAIVDTPAFGLLAAHEQAADLKRIALVADAGRDPIAVVSVLTGGMDLIIWTPGRTAFTPTVERGLAARLRTTQATLLALGPGLRRPDYRLDATPTGFHGIGDGSGCLSGFETTIASSGRNLAPTRTRIRIQRANGALEASTMPGPGVAAAYQHRRAGT